MQATRVSEPKDLVAEMGFDLATSLFLFRWLAHLKAVAVSRRAKAWWGFSLATLLGLLGLFLYMAEAVLVYEVFRIESVSLRSEETAVFLSRIEIRILIAVLVLGVVLLASSTRYLWALFPLSTFVLVALMLVVRGLWHGEWSAVLLIPMAVAFPLVFYYLLAFPLFLVQAPLLVLYPLLTRSMRNSALVSLAWKENGFSSAAGDLLALLRKIREDHREFKRRRGSRFDKALDLVAIGLVLAGTVAVGWIYERWLSDIPFGGMVGKLLYILIVIGLILGLGALSPGGIYPPNSFTPAEWIERLRKASREEQKELLRRTDPRSLGLHKEEFLELLRSVDEHIWKRARSEYRDRLNRLEEELQTEREATRPAGARPFT